MKLIELSGKATAAELKNATIRDLSDIDAAIWFLAMLVKNNPELTWGDLLNKKFTMAGNVFGDFGNWLVDTGGNIVDGAGDKFGDAVRLFTDEDVQSGLQRYGEMGAAGFAAYSSGGASAILPAMFGGQGDQQQQQVGFAAMGQQVKNAFGGVNPTMLYIGGGALFFMMMMMMMMQKR